MARELAAAERAAVYGRIGTTTQAFGTLASWLVDVLNVVTGNLDRPGGAMFPLAAAGQANSVAAAKAVRRCKGWRHGRWRSRVRDLPEVMGELPVATLAEEILTPGAGTGACPVRRRRQPLPEHPERGPAARGGADPRPHGVAGRLPQRDQRARRRDPARADAAGARPLRRDLHPAVGAQHGQLEPGRAGRPTCPRSGRRCCGWPASPPGRGPAADIEALDDLDGRADGRAVRPGPGGGAAVGAGRPGCSTSCCAADPTTSPSPTSRLPRTGSTSARSAPRPRGAAHRQRSRSSWPPSRSRATSRGWSRPLERGPGEPDALVLIGRRQLGSNNSWMHNLAPLVAGLEHLHRARAPRRRGAARPARRRRRGGPVPGRVRHRARSRSPTPCGRAS